MAGKYRDFRAIFTMLAKEHNSCATCRLYDICLPLGLNSDELHQFSDIMAKNQVFKANESIFKEKERFSSLYVVRSGCIKTHRLSGVIADRITGFFIAGEILGLEAIHTEIYQDTAVALDTVSLCEIKFDSLLSIAAVAPNLQKQLVRLMSEKISCGISEGERDTSAEKRIANFILNLSTRFKRSGFSGMNFILPMSKKDIADYLGIATETMSRVLTRLHDKDILLINKKEINITDIRKLQEIACGTPL